MLAHVSQPASTSCHHVRPCMPAAPTWKRNWDSPTPWLRRESTWSICSSSAPIRKVSAIGLFAETFFKEARPSIDWFSERSGGPGNFIFLLPSQSVLCLSLQLSSASRGLCRLHSPLSIANCPFQLLACPCDIRAFQHCFVRQDLQPASFWQASLIYKGP